MIRPIIAMINPYETAKEFEKCGWKIDFQTPPDGKDPLAGVSLYENELLLGIINEKYVKKQDVPYVGTGIELHIVIPAIHIQKKLL